MTRATGPKRKPAHGYKPQPHSVAWQVLQYLGTLPRGTLVSTAQLGAVVGKPAQAMPQFLSAARQAGLLECYRDPDGYRALHWFLPDPAAPTEERDRRRRGTPGVEDVQQRVVRWPPGRRERIDGLALQPRPNGELAIETAQHLIVLTPRAAQRLYALAQQAQATTPAATSGPSAERQAA